MAKKIISAKDGLAKLDEIGNLGDALLSDFNKRTGSTDAGAYHIGEQDAPTDITTLVGTGSTVLDTIITNGKWSPGAGFPVRRLIEIHGNTSAGKSLLANHVLINTQKMGGIPILCDSENSTDISLLVKMGLLVGDKATEAGLHKLTYVPVKTVEHFFETAEFMVKKIRELGSKKFITIVWDSIAGTPSESELEGNFTKEGYGTQKALAISLAMRKITQFLYREDVLFVFTNQIRSSVGGFGFGDKFVTPGGHAVPFHSSVRIRLAKLEDIKKGDVTIGVRIQAQTRKNKIAPPMRKCTFDVYFDRGIDDENSWFENLVSKEVIRRPTTKTYEVDTPEGAVQFQKPEWMGIVHKHHSFFRELVIKANTLDYTNLSPSAVTETGVDDIQSVPEEEEMLTEEN